MKRLIYTFFLTLIIKGAFAQIEHPVQWSYSSRLTGKNEAVVLLKATIEPGWHIYSAYQASGGPVKTSFAFSTSADYTLKGTIVEPVPTKKFEKSFDMDVKFFEQSVIFQQAVILKKQSVTIKGKLNFMVCNDHQCLPPEEVDFAIPIK